MKTYKIRLNFIRDIIGSQPSSEEIKTDYIMSKMLTGRTGMSAEIAQERIKEEINNLKKDPAYQELINKLDDKSLTVFYRNDKGEPSMSDVQIRGFFKDAFAFVAKEDKLMTKKDGSIYSGDAKYRNWIGARLSFQGQYFPFNNPKIDIFQRPLRAETMQGPRVSIASSERIKAPQEIIFSVNVTDDVTLDILKKILDRGQFKGLGQWANAQWGAFNYEIIS